MRKTLVSFFVLSLLLHIEKITAIEDRLVTGCPLSVESRQLMQDLIADFLLDTLYIAESTGIHPNGVPSKAQIAYSSTLIGSVRGVEARSRSTIKIHMGSNM